MEMAVETLDAHAQQAGAASRPWAVVLDFLERAGWSAGQVFFATLLAGGTAIGTIAGLPWEYSTVVALGAAVASVVLTGVQYVSKVDVTRLRPPWCRFWVDLLLRLAKTFLASLAGSFAAAHPFDIVTFGWATAVNVAAIATLGVLAKGLLARGNDGEGRPSAGRPADANPSTLPPDTYRTAVSG